MPGEALYKQILGNIAVSISENSYQASIIKETEEEFWNNVINIASVAKARFHDKLPNVNSGITDGELKGVLRVVVPTVRQLTWPIKTYTVGEDKKRPLKIPVIIGILHNVYNFGSNKIPEMLVVRNPEKPYTYITMRTEMVEKGITTQIAEDYAKLLYGYGKESGASKEYVHFLREKDMGIPPGRTLAEQGIEQKIKDASEIPALKELDQAEEQSAK